jgi:26S proteasome regulatory subunit N1
VYFEFVSFQGLGLAYAGSNRDDVLSLLLPVLSHPKSSMEVVGVAALACGLVAVASCNGDVTSALLQTLMEKSEAVEAVVLALEVLAEPFKVC